VTPKHQRFIQEYLVDHSAKHAALRAGYSPKCANQYGNKLLRLPKIQNELRKHIDERTQRTHIDQDYIVNRLFEIVERGLGHDIDQPLPNPPRNGHPAHNVIYTTPSSKHEPSPVFKLFRTDPMEVTPNHAIRALLLLSRYTGGFDPKSKDTQDVNLIIDTGVPGAPGSQAP